MRGIVRLISSLCVCLIATGATLSVAEADERDDIVKEYHDVCGVELDKASLVRAVSAFNTSDYKSWMRDDGDLNGIYTDVLKNFRGSVVVDVNGNPYTVNGKVVRIPRDATVRIASGWRNPRRNERVGSVVKCASQHLLGRALDLVPDIVAGELEDGASVALDLKKHLFPTLWAAARLAGFAIAETGNVPVPCGTIEDHVHVHRR